MWENIVERDRLRTKKRRMLIACCVPKVTNTDSGCVTLIALPLPQWLHERASMLPYTYIAFRVFLLSWFNLYYWYVLFIFLSVPSRPPLLPSTRHQLTIAIGIMSLLPVLFSVGGPTTPNLFLLPYTSITFSTLGYWLRSLVLCCIEKTQHPSAQRVQYLDIYNLWYEDCVENPYRTTEAEPS